MSRKFRPSGSGSSAIALPQQPAQQHHHKPIGEMTLAETCLAILSICQKVCSGRIEVVGGDRGDDSRDAKKSFRIVCHLIGEQNYADAMKEVDTIVSAVGHNRISYKGDNVSRQQAFHLRDLRLRLHYHLGNGNGGGKTKIHGTTATGTVDCAPCVPEEASVRG